MTEKKKSKPNAIEEAIGDRTVENPKKKTPEKITKNIETQMAFPKETPPIPQNPSRIADVPSPQEMLSLEELNRRTEERLQNYEPNPEVKTAILETQIPYVPPKMMTPVSKPDPQPVTETSSPESPPQKIDESSQKAFEITKNIKKSNAQTLQEVRSGVSVEENEPYIGFDELIQELNPPVEDIELTALRKYILEDGFVVATVAFHIVSLCAQPMTTPSTTMWDFRDRAMIPDMVLALLNQPGYLEGIWPSLRIVMGSNKGNAAWSAGIATTIAFFDVVRTLPALKELQNEDR